MIVNGNSIVQHANYSNQKWNNKTCQCECTKYISAQQIIGEILADVFVKMASA